MKGGHRLSPEARARIGQARAARGFSVWRPDDWARSPQLRLFDHVSLAPPDATGRRPLDADDAGQLALVAPEPVTPDLFGFDESREAAEQRRAGEEFKLLSPP